MTKPEVNYFTTLGLAEKFSLNLQILDTRIAELQAQVHPDKFVGATHQEKQLALQYSATLNEAYLIVKDPFKRAVHILELHGIEAMSETQTHMPEAFLMKQLALREKLELAEDHPDRQIEIKDILREVDLQLKKAKASLAPLLDAISERSLEHAYIIVRQIQFFIRLQDKAKTVLEDKVT